MNNLPKNWCECKLEDCVEIILGQSPKSETYNDKEDGIPFFQGKADFGTIYPNVRFYCNKPSKIAKNGDILLSIRAPVGAVNISNLNCCIGRGLAALRGKGNIQNNFVYFLIKAYEIILHQQSTGTTFDAITGNALKNINIILPPIEEQGRIVEKIEELFSDIDNGIKDLKTAQAQIKQYRQSVLKSAFEGKLYKTSEWKEVKLEDVCQINPKTEIKDMKDDDIVSFLPMTSVKAECNYYTEENVLYSKVKKGYTKFKNGDVLFAKITPCMENGKVCIVDNLIQDIGFGSTEFHILRCLNNIIPKYVYYVVIQQCFRKKAKKNMVGAVGQQRVPADFMKNFDILLPSLLEQQQIVAEIEKRFLVADELEKAVNEGLEKADKLKQSILKKAFEGKLVPQDPNDEPASALLDRIKKEQKPTKGKKK